MWGYYGAAIKSEKWIKSILVIDFLDDRSFWEEAAMVQFYCSALIEE